MQKLLEENEKMRKEKMELYDHITELSKACLDKDKKYSDLLMWYKNLREKFLKKGEKEEEKKELDECVICFEEITKKDKLYGCP